MRYLEAGSGWPVLLIHAFPLNADMWRPQLERVPSGWRYIAPDLRGFGPSVRSEAASTMRGLDGSRVSETSADQSMTLRDYAWDLTSLLDALHIDEAIIGGLSMGGYVTFEIFRQSPERFTGMLLADTRPQADTPDGRAGRAKLRVVLAERGSAAVADDMIPKLLSERAGPELIAETRRMIEINEPMALDQALAAMMERPDSTPDLPRISCPVLVVAGDHDTVTPVSDGQRMQQAIPRSFMTVIPGAGHLSNLERPIEFSRALHDFLVAHM
jgi:3-oxoadipate enol-lactonase